MYRSIADTGNRQITGCPGKYFPRSDDMGGSAFGSEILYINGSVSDQVDLGGFGAPG
jgi:hypothetical protein